MLLHVITHWHWDTFYIIFYSIISDQTFLLGVLILIAVVDWNCFTVG